MSNGLRPGSIGLPIRNSENYPVETLDSLLAQRYEDFELIIYEKVQQIKLRQSTSLMVPATSVFANTVRRRTVGGVGISIANFIFPAASRCWTVVLR